MTQTTLPPDFSNIRVMVGIPQPEYTSAQFTNCLWDLLFTSRTVGIEVGRTLAVGSVIARNRNLLVEHAKTFNATHLLQIDADGIFPANALIRLLAHDKDIVCATTCERSGMDRKPVAEPEDRRSLTPHQTLVPMKLVGFPMHLTKMSVFEKLRKPYFADPPRWMVQPEHLNSPDVMQEDEYFCVATKAQGFQSFCDMNLTMEIGHLGLFTYYVK